MLDRLRDPAACHPRPQQTQIILGPILPQEGSIRVLDIESINIDIDIDIDVDVDVDANIDIDIKIDVDINIDNEDLDQQASDNPKLSLIRSFLGLDWAL